MPKSGVQRAADYAAKVDAEVFSKRAKYSKRRWAENYLLGIMKPSFLDEHADFKKTLYGLKTTERSVFREMFERLFNMTRNATEEEIEAKHQEWLVSGLSEALWLNALDYCNLLHSWPDPFLNIIRPQGIDIICEVRVGDKFLTEAITTLLTAEIPYFYLDESTLDYFCLG